MLGALSRREIGLVLLMAAATPHALGQGTARPNTDPNEGTVIRIKTTPPSPEELFRLETESQFRERIRNETRGLMDKFEVPDFQPPPGRPLARFRGWNLQSVVAEPDRLCFVRLLFVPRADERYARDLGGLQPVVSTGYFYFDLAKMPFAVVSRPCSWMQCDNHGDLISAPLPDR
jgi:hypothetical protein